MSNYYIPKETVAIPKYFESPNDFLRGYGAEPEKTEEYYKAFGIEITGEDGELFYIVKLPEGWKMKNDGYWVNVYDDKDRTRFTFFVKLCPWDTDAFTHKARRFSCRRNWDLGRPDPEEDDAEIQIRVVDGDGSIPFACDVATIVNESKDLDYDSEEARIKRVEWRDKIKAEEQRQYALCEAWLKEHYPDWESYTAYWD